LIFRDKPISRAVFVYDLTLVQEQVFTLWHCDGSDEADSQNNPEFRANWAVVRDWTETSRYETRTRIQAADLYQAISQRNTGILAWIRLYW
jgi:hypothetical protein